MSYFSRFGTPSFSGHAFARCIERGITLVEVDAALRTEPVDGSQEGTLWYRGPDVLIVVDAASGTFITMWRP